jgi:hypothetical protein
MLPSTHYMPIWGQTQLPRKYRYLRAAGRSGRQFLRQRNAKFMIVCLLLLCNSSSHLAIESLSRDTFSRPRKKGEI